MVDDVRVLAKLDELDGYLRELRSVVPADFDEYLRIEKKRACERLVQVAVEAALDVCALLVARMRLGLPGEEDDLFEKLVRRRVISAPMVDTLRRTKGLRNMLLHEHGRLNDELVFEVVSRRLSDFEAFKNEVLAFLGA